MSWYSTADSSFGADMDAPPGDGFGVNVFLRDGEKRLPHLAHQRLGTEQLSHTSPLTDLLRLGPPGTWQDSPGGWPQVASRTRADSTPGRRPAVWPSSGAVATPRGARRRPGRSCRRCGRSAQHQPGRHQHRQVR